VSVFQKLKEQNLQWALMLCGVEIALIFGYWWLVRRTRRVLNRRILICPGGLAIQEPGNEKTLPWEALTESYYKEYIVYVMGFQSAKAYSLTLCCADGSKLEFTDEQFENVKEGAQLIQQKLSSHQSQQRKGRGVY
jgi:hypothetical protein